MSTLQTELAVLLPSIIAFLAVAVKVITQISSIITRLEALLAFHVATDPKSAFKAVNILNRQTVANATPSPAPPQPGGPDFREG